MFVALLDLWLAVLAAIYNSTVCYCLIKRRPARHSGEAAEPIVCVLLPDSHLKK